MLSSVGDCKSVNTRCKNDGKKSSFISCYDDERHKPTNENNFLADIGYYVRVEQSGNGSQCARKLPLQFTALSRNGGDLSNAFEVTPGMFQQVLCTQETVTFKTCPNISMEGDGCTTTTEPANQCRPANGTFTMEVCGAPIERKTMKSSSASSCTLYISALIALIAATLAF